MVFRLCSIGTPAYTKYNQVTVSPGVQQVTVLDKGSNSYSGSFVPQGKLSLNFVYHETFFLLFQL